MNHLTDEQARELATTIWAAARSAASLGRAERDYSIYRITAALLKCFPNRETFPPMMGGWY